MTRTTGISDALFGDLDGETRQRFGLTDPEARAPGPEAQAVDPAPSVPVPGLRDMSRQDLITVARRTFTAIGEDRVTSVSGGVTFFGLLSLFPAISAFVSLYGLWADPLTIQGHLDMLEPVLPEGTLAIVESQVVTIASASTGVLSLAGIMALMIAFWSANGGMKALLSALNVAEFQRETRSFIRLNLVAMCFTLGALAMIALMLGVIAVVPIVLRMLPVGWGVETALSIIRWPLMMGLLIIGLAAVYRWGPAAPQSRWRWVSPGAIIAAFALLATSMLFSWYAANFGDYNETYGTLGAVVALMTWLWLNATIVLIGAEINSEVERQLKEMAGLQDTRTLGEKR